MSGTVTRILKGTAKVAFAGVATVGLAVGALFALDDMDTSGSGGYAARSAGGQQQSPDLGDALLFGAGLLAAGGASALLYASGGQRLSQRAPSRFNRH